MELGDLMTAIAAVIDAKKGAIGIDGASYPPLNRVPSSPWVMVRQSMTGITQVTKARAGQQVVSPAIDLVGLVVANPLKPAEAARLDRILHPLLDLFDANANGGNVNYAFSGLRDESGDRIWKDNVDRIWNEAMVRRATVKWGESGDCHALVITLDAQFMRKAVMP